MSIYEDIGTFHFLKTTSLATIEQLFKFVVNSSPGELSASKLAKNLGKDFESVSSYLRYLEQAGLIRFIYSSSAGQAYLKNPIKMYPENSNRIYAMNLAILQDQERGKVRETFVVNQIQSRQISIFYSQKEDFKIEDHIFDVGGKGKTTKPIRGEKNALLLSDDLLVGASLLFPCICSVFCIKFSFYLRLNMKTMQKVVVKVGTSSLTQGGNKLSRRYMLELVQQLVSLQDQGIEVVLVSSGAIAGGRELLNFPKVDRSLSSKQMFSSIGQAKLMQIWSELFSLYDRHVGQILLTRDDFSHRKRYLNARDSLHCLLKHGVIPVVNENDAVATEEIRVGDNDNLAALVANLIEADSLILLTDQEGLFTADPRSNVDAKLIPVVKNIDKSIFALAGDSATSLGTGGMSTKIEAAQIASQSGTRTFIVSSAHPNVLHELSLGKSVGTLFQETSSVSESRKRWLLSEKRRGMIHVDAGATLKIMHHGASLLSSGILKASQSFERGAAVEVIAETGEAIAVGIANYGSKEVDQLVGKHSNAIEEILGYTYGPEIIHRTNMTRIKFSKEIV